MGQTVANKYSRIVIFLFLTLAIYPTILLNASKQNVLLLGLMALSPFVWFVCRFVVGRIDIPLLLMYLLMVAFPCIFHPATVRWSTLIYTGMYVSFFIAYVKLLYCSDLTAISLMKVLRILLFAYAIVLIVQQICFFAGLPIFNAINIDVRPSAFPRLNSIGPEPAWTARNVCLMMFIYILLYQHTLNKELTLKKFWIDNHWLCISFLYVILTCGSATGILFVVLILFKFVNARSLLGVVVGAVLCVTVINRFTTISSVERVMNLIPAVMTLDERAIMHADRSGASRIIPTIQAMKHLSLTTVDGWVGHGVDYDTKIIRFPGIKANGGGFSLWLNYGALVQFLFLGVVFSVCYIKREPCSLLFCILILFGGITINIQILWFMLALFATYKFVTQ